MATSGDYVGVQVLTAEEGLELGGVVDRPAREQRLQDTSPCFVAEATPVLRAYELTKSVVRVLVRAIYLFPVLLVAKLALWAAAHAGADALGRVGDYLTVAFVLLVVVFFFWLSLLVLLHVWVGPRSQRASRCRFRFELPRAVDLPRSRALVQLPAPLDLSDAAEPAAEARSKIRVRGELVAVDGAASGTPLVRESWLETPEGAARLVQARHFAVVAEGQLPVVVQIHAAPWLLLDAAAGAGSPIRVGEDRRAAFEALLRPHGASLLQLGAGLGRALCAGQEVELVGVVAERLPQIEGASVGGQPVRLGGSTSMAPYRGSGGAGLLLVSSASEPVLLAARS